MKRMTLNILNSLMIQIHLKETPNKTILQESKHTSDKLNSSQEKRKLTSSYLKLKLKLRKRE